MADEIIEGPPLFMLDSRHGLRLTAARVGPAIILLQISRPLLVSEHFVFVLRPDADGFLLG